MFICLLRSVIRSVCEGLKQKLPLAGITKREKRATIVPLSDIRFYR